MFALYKVHKFLYYMYIKDVQFGQTNSRFIYLNVIANFSFWLNKTKVTPHNEKTADLKNMTD